MTGGQHQHRVRHDDDDGNGNGNGNGNGDSAIGRRMPNQLRLTDASFGTEATYR